MEGAPAIVDRCLTAGMAPHVAVQRAVAFLAILLMVTLLAGGARKRPEIKGLIMTRDFVIPAGQSVTVVQDTIILASRKIEIYGTVFVNPGMNVSFRSPTVHIEGEIQHIPGITDKLQTAMTSVRSFEQWLYQAQPPVPQTWPGRGILGCNTFTRKSPAQTPPTDNSPPLPLPGN